MTSVLGVIRVYKECVGDWHGNARIHDDSPQPIKVVRISHYSYSNNVYRICAWGNDDFGLEKEYTDESESKIEFLKILSEKEISKDFLKDMGFTNA